MQRVKKFLSKIDFFATSQLLRYAKQPRYATLTGGICSMSLLLVFCVLFINMGLMTINKQLIFSSSDFINQVDPSLTVIQMYPQGDFMFAVCIQSMDLTQKRYFDIFLVVDTKVNGTKTQESRRLESCTSDFFPPNKNGNSLYKQLWNSCLCPPQNFTFSLEGTISSQKSTMLDIVVKKCDPTLLDHPLPCQSDQSLDAWEQQFSSEIVDLYFVNPLINPSVEEYLTTFIESRIFVVFSRQLSSECYVSVADFSITTDLNILPYTDNHIDIGTVIEPSTINYRAEVNNSAPANATLYAVLYIIKSNTVTSYQRSFNKIDSFMSYIGGLAGALFSFLFFLNSYTNMSIELEIGGKLYRKDSISTKNAQQSKNNMNQSFNLITYFLYLGYIVLRWLGCRHSSFERVNQYELYRREVREQIDIIFMFDRLAFLEKAVQMMIDEAQLDGLHLIERPTIEEGTVARKKYALQQRIEQIYQQAHQHKKKMDTFQSSKISEEVSPQENLHSSFSLTRNNLTFNSSNRTGMFANDCYISQEKQVQQDIENIDMQSAQIYRSIADMMKKLKLSSQNGNSLSKNILKHFSSVVKSLEINTASSKKGSNSKVDQQGRTNMPRNISINQPSATKYAQCQ